MFWVFYWHTLSLKDFDLTNINNYLSNKLAIRSEAPSNWSHNDKVMLSNLINLGHQDISQTLDKQKRSNLYGDGRNVEQNPIVAPFVKSPEMMRGGGLLLQALLGKRWNDMQNERQKQAEMILANLIEANAMSNSKEPWRLTFGREF